MVVTCEQVMLLNQGDEKLYILLFLISGAKYNLLNKCSTYTLANIINGLNAGVSVVCVV